MTPALERAKGVLMAGVAGSGPERAREAMAQWPDLKIFENVDELIRDESVQVVYVASPHFLHVPQAVQAIENKKHVFMEAPMALSVDGAHKLAEKAKEHGVKLGVASQFRYHPAVAALRDEIAGGSLGAIKHLSVRCTEPLSLSRGWWNDANRSGPAALLRLGVHAVDLAAWLHPKPVAEVMAMGIDEGDPAVNTIVSCLLRFEDDSMGYVLGASAFKDPDHSVRVEGAQKRLYVEGDFNGADPAILHELVDGEEDIQEFDPNDPVVRMIEAFNRAVLEDVDFMPEALESLETVKVTCAVIESMRGRRSVKVNEIVRQSA